jgi:RhoGEF domain
VFDSGIVKTRREQREKVYDAQFCFYDLQSITTQHNPDSLRRRYLIQLINREQHFISAMNFGMERFVTPMKERKDLISTNDHRTLYQNIDELVQLSEDILEQLLQNDHDPQIHFASRVYLSKSMAICAAYKKYCNGLKRADCVLVIRSRTKARQRIDV